MSERAPTSNSSTDSLRAELDALNTELRELKSTDYAVRAYIETWIAVVTGLATSKMLYDWQKVHSKPPLVAFPLGFFALAVLVDSLTQRLKQRALAKEEERKLQRQRELRRLLGLEDADIPASALTPQPSTT